MLLKIVLFNAKKIVILKIGLCTSDILDCNVMNLCVCVLLLTGTALSRPPRDFSDTRGKDGRAEGFNLSVKCVNNYLEEKKTHTNKKNKNKQKKHHCQSTLRESKLLPPFTHA